MRYHNIAKDDMLNGHGLRITIWLSACSHSCIGCYNPQTHSPYSGIEFDVDAETELFTELSKPYISGITFSGGDPLHENNLSKVLELVDKICVSFPDKSIWLYTGYTWEQIFNGLEDKRKDIVSKCDVLIDGRYIQELRDTTLKWRGSSNQRIIDVKESLKQSEVILFET